MGYRVTAKHGVLVPVQLPAGGKPLGASAWYRRGTRLPYGVPESTLVKLAAKRLIEEEDD
jgi:hypothetical protein